MRGEGRGAGEPEEKEWKRTGVRRTSEMDALEFYMEMECMGRK